MTPIKSTDLEWHLNDEVGNEIMNFTHKELLQCT